MADNENPSGEIPAQASNLSGPGDPAAIPPGAVDTGAAEASAPVANPGNAAVPPVQTVTGADLVNAAPVEAPAPAVKGRGRPRGSKTRNFRPGGPQDTPERRAAVAGGGPDPEPAPERPEAADFSDITGAGPGPEAGTFADLNQAPAAPPVNYEKLAEMLFDMSASGLSIVLGPEWQPQSQDERAAVVGPLRAYMEAKQMRDIPPGYLLAIVLVCYAGPRLQVPNTRTKLVAFWFWSRDKILRPVKGFLGRMLGGGNHRPASQPSPPSPQ